MHIKKPFTGFVILAAIVCGNGLAYAQPDPNVAAMGMNPAAAADWAKMTPAQRREAAQKFVEQTLRGAMTGLGFADKPLQDDVVAFSIEQEKLLEPVRKKHRAVAYALLEDTEDEEVTDLMAQLQASVAEATAKRQTAIAALDEKIHFSQKPRLAALLSMTGLTGNETSFIGGTFSGILTTLANMTADEAEKPEVKPE